MAASARRESLPKIFLKAWRDNSARFLMLQFGLANWPGYFIHCHMRLLRVNFILPFSRAVSGSATFKSLTQVFSLLVMSLALSLPAHATTAPTITPPTGVYSTYQSTATITADTGATIYYTTDGSTPVVGVSPVYSTPIALADPMTIKAIASLSGVNSTVTTAYIQSDPNTLPVPRTGLQLWLKSDYGPITTGSNVTQWSDLSGATVANNATQATSTKQPTLVSGAINGYSAVNFNGTSQYFSLTSGLGDLTSGYSAFAVIKPANTTAAFIVTSGNTGPADQVSLQTTNTQGQFNAYNGTTASSVVTSPGALTLNKFQLLDAVHNGAASATVSVNSIASQTGTVQNLINTSRTQNYVGANNTITSWWKGQIAELLVYSRGVTTSEQASIEAYLSSRYQFATATVTPTPILSVATSTLTAPTSVAISSVPTATVYITLDGTTPTTSSPVYTGPVLIYYTQTLKALAVNNGISSTVASATYTLNATQWPAPSATDTTPLQINLQLPTTAIPQ